MIWFYSSLSGIGQCTSSYSLTMYESFNNSIRLGHHHLPTFAAIDKRYSGDPLNVAFATDLGNCIADSRINAWIYGHAHHQTDLMIGNTHLVSNPLGYVFAGESAAFNDSAVIEI